MIYSIAIPFKGSKNKLKRLTAEYTIRLVLKLRFIIDSGIRKEATIINDNLFVGKIELMYSSIILKAVIMPPFAIFDALFIYQHSLTTAY
jgi:hypothetical protein